MIHAYLRYLFRLHRSWFICPRSGPLLGAALLVGTGASVFWTFGVDYLGSADTLTTTQGRLFLAAVGVSSVLAVVADDAVRRLGSTAMFASSTALLGLSVCLLAMTPTLSILAVPSAVLFGATYNVTVAIEVLWSSRVFRERPSTGLAAVMFMSGLGLLAGPILSGWLADRLGLGPVLFGASVLLLLTGLLFPREEWEQHSQEQAA